ncbi:MAG: rod shape-determining protein MreC [Crocinitomicaceae bacterium]|jgi:rod shape-determining protein MreC|nr:rod shape-determining protein MreC [Crocinitomicaceae bacterium]MDP4723255.1 rod shape-determining protein MreC [Crocinitomicaceae bacterium]MDP4739875.1 rod shape-determining protein MreC [Crocinitomicaceae bacterium]MDP4799578.1 rod shape-determining protein MreC [Crocinitomicaceae bacterium]MDP4805527.1 rod shape-determining protein MreC [Crocinitomicaceae bacterium]
MRNLIAFLQRFRIFLVFAVLQILALSWYVTYLSFPRNQFLTTNNNIAIQMLEWEHDLTKHFNLSKNNTQLQWENIYWRKRQPKFMYQLSRAKVKINDTVFEQQYTYIPAEVINSSVDRRNNYFTLNVGSAQGIKRGMGVFCQEGVVGVIHYASKHYSLVKTVLTKNINIDVNIHTKKSDLPGFIKWDGQNARYGTITGINNDLRVKKWSKVVTRGGSGIFPKGIPVGKVSHTEPIEGQALWKVDILFSADYRRLQRVYVIKNLHLAEQTALEARIPSDDE